MSRDDVIIPDCLFHTNNNLEIPSSLKVEPDCNRGETGRVFVLDRGVLILRKK